MGAIGPATLHFGTVGRVGDWMQTATGRRYFPIDPRPEDVHIEDIAAALSKLCRYGGNTTRFYSVAEHSVHVAEAAPAEHKLAALMHDASEAYLVDIIRPVKPALSNYREIEDRNMAAIAQRFGFTWPMPPDVKRLDESILHDEKAQVMAPCSFEWCTLDSSAGALGITLPCWSPDKAEYEFRAAFSRYGGHYA